MSEQKKNLIRYAIDAHLETRRRFEEQQQNYEREREERAAKQREELVTTASGVLTGTFSLSGIKWEYVQQGSNNISNIEWVIVSDPESRLEFKVMVKGSRQVYLHTEDGEDIRVHSLGDLGKQLSDLGYDK